MREKKFEPINKESAPKLSEKQQNTEEPVEDETDSTEAKDSENVTLLDSVMEHEENLSEEEKKKRAISETTIPTSGISVERMSCKKT